MLMDFFTNKYPRTDFHQLNLDWCITAILQLQDAFNDFSAGNKLIFANPLQHDLTKTYAKNTIVVDSVSGSAYLSLDAVPVGVQLDNTDYWLPVFDFAGYITRANQNFTDNYFSGTDRAPYALAVGDWIVLDDVLYKVTQAIAADGIFIIDTNIVHFTVEEFVKDFVSSVNTTLTNWYNQMTATINQYKNEIDASELAYRQQLAQDIADTTASLQAQLDAAIAGATVDSEVINARVGDDGITYNTLGNAIRGQFSDIKKLVPRGWITIDASTLGFANGRLEPDRTINTTYNTRQYVFLDPAYDYFVWCEPDAKITYAAYHSDVILPNPNLLTAGDAKVPGYIRGGDRWYKVLDELIGGKYNVIFIAYNDDSIVDNALYNKIHIYRRIEKSWTKTQNLFKPLYNRFISATGEFPADDSYRTGAYIKVENNTRIYFRSKTPLGNIAIGCYDSNNNFIGRQTTTYYALSEYYFVFLDVLPDTAYIICAFVLGTNDEPEITASFNPYCNYVDTFIGGGNGIDALYKATYINKLPNDYTGKLISFLGDSITTYAGENADVAPDGHLIADGTWTYAGNHCRYPQNNLLQTPFFCYWVKLFLSLGMELGINDSWAGSYVSWDGITQTGDIGENIYMGSQTRIAHLNDNGTPDIIVVNGGTNDIINNVPIGTFNTENPVNYTDAQIAALPVDTFADAYRTMLIRLMKSYPLAQIVCMLPNFTNSIYYDAEKVDEYCEMIKTICDYFGVSCIDMRNSGITIYNTATYLGDGVHPNAKGMQNLFKNLYKYFLYEM